MNVIFIHVPKTAGSSIEESLGLIKARTVGKFRRRFKGDGWYSFGHLDVRKRLRKKSLPRDFYNKAFKFCFCRNPYDRAVSHYFYARKRHSHEFPLDVSFIGFTRTLGDYGRMFRLQTFYTDGLDFDFIGRFENLEQDFKKVTRAIGKPCALIKKNETEHKPYWAYYCEESVRNVAEFYTKDFEFFGYSKDDHRLLHLL